VAWVCDSFRVRVLFCFVSECMSGVFVYRFDRLLNNARQLRISRALRVQEEGIVVGGYPAWLQEWHAGKHLVGELNGIRQVRFDKDGNEIVDKRATGREDILDLAPLAPFIERGEAALRTLAEEMGLEAALISAASARIRQKLTEEVPADERVVGRAAKNRSDDPAVRAARRAIFIDQFVKTKEVTLRDAAVLAIETALFEIVERFRWLNDEKRETASRPDTAIGDLVIVDGQVRRKRKPRGPSKSTRAA
jgi:hypothetical protein